MAFFGKLNSFGIHLRDEDDELRRITSALRTLIVAALVGLGLILSNRLIQLDFDQVPSILTVSAALALSLALIRNGRLTSARALSLWSLLLFLIYQCYKDDGIHDIALFAFPGLLAMAALVLTPSYFLVYTGCSLVSVALLGYLESTGVIQTPYSSTTNATRVFDLVAIFAVTTVPIRLLVDNFKKILARVRRHEEEIKAQADRLSESENRYRMLFDGANDAILIMSGDRFVECNEMTLKMFRCQTKSDIVGHSPWEFSPELQPDGRPSREKATEVIQSALDGAPQRFYWKHLCADGAAFDSEVSLNRIESGTDVLIQAFVTDITVRLGAEEALRESEARFRTLFESQGEGTGIVDEQERFILCNPAAEAILGVEPGGLSGRSLRQFVSQEQWDNVLSQTAHRRVGARNTYEMEVLRPDGKRRNLVVTATPRFQGDVYVGAFGVFRDITDQKELEWELMQTQKIQSLGTLAGGIAHDFNNILGIILGYSSKMEKGKQEPQRIAEGLSAINIAVNRGAALVHQILTFARRTDVASKAMSLPDLVRELISMLQRTFPKIISITMEIEDDIPIIHADQTQIHQALLNLCVNARDAMPAGGEMVISLSTVDGKELGTRYPAADRQRYVCASVRDTGTGMDKETKARVFDPFFTTKEKGKGTGLGLSVVYGIMQNHHGFVEIESRIDNGSAFSLYFPVDEHTGLMETGIAGSIEIPRGSETILVVEDEPLLQDLMRSRFEANGYRVLVANDGLHAVELYSHHRSEIAVVFSDMGLPKLTGENVFRKLKELNPDVQVVFAGGFLEPELKAAMLEDGVKAFVQKPYEPDDILVLIRRLLDGD